MTEPASATSAFPANVLADLEEMESQDLIPVAESICRHALKRLPTSDSKNRFKIGMKLLKYLISCTEEPLPSENIEEAIKILRQLADFITRNNRTKMTDSWLFLGYLFQRRQRGSRISNLKEAFKWYSLARRAYERRRTRRDLALATVALGEVYAALGGKDNFDKAIRLTKEALRIYTPKQYPDDNTYYRRAVEQFRAQRDRVGVKAKVNK